MRAVAYRLVLASILLVIVSHAVIMPVIAAAKSYRPFMEEVNRRVKPSEKLYLYGGSFNSDPVVFYRGETIETLEQPPQAIAAKIGRGYTILLWRGSNGTRFWPPTPMFHRPSWRVMEQGRKGTLGWFSYK